MELMDLIPKKAVMETNLAPILKTIYTWHCLKWPKSFIDDGFGVIKSNKKDFSKWVFEFNNLRENIFIDKWHFGNKVAFMDLYIQGK